MDNIETVKTIILMLIDIIGNTVKTVLMNISTS